MNSEEQVEEGWLKQSKRCNMFKFDIIKQKAENDYVKVSGKNLVTHWPYENETPNIIEEQYEMLKPKLSIDGSKVGNMFVFGTGNEDSDFILNFWELLSEDD